ncbi:MULTISPECIES: DUF4382 domain-containing protein [Halorussus]|uniref:DUF4382 domain-containing protein n=1 Tax=Halorussus TaxID=1070314 RepID=UPI00209F9A59|nr:DUF4382 domain-containing protein [Halorussus vallis]USZ73829.1 DUF4382 domain-containing protein [Halorussus vallis]
MTKRHAAVLLTAMLLLAGCTGGTGSTATTSAGPATTAEATETGTETATAGTASAGATTAGESAAVRTDGRATVEFYVSDERNAMGDFEHLNVTVTEVGLKAAGEGDASWTTFDVDDRTVDLTELAGANASHLGALDAANGTYQTVFVHVSEVNGTLTGGESVNVKLPSSKLQIHEEFSLGANQSVDYVFDISVFAAGKSGKYILKPVVSESGTDVAVDPVGEKKGKDSKEKSQKGKQEKGDDRSDEGTDAALNASFVGNVTRGGNATLAVAQNGTAVANATVSVNGESVGETDADGRLTFAVPDAAELEVEVETDDESVELKLRLGDEGGD